MKEFLLSPRFRKYVLVGLTVAIVDFTILNLGVKAFHLLPVIATSISFIIANTYGFSVNRSWTFTEQSTRKSGYNILFIY